MVTILRNPAHVVLVVRQATLALFRLSEYSSSAIQRHGVADVECLTQLRRSVCSHILRFELRALTFSHRAQCRLLKCRLSVLFSDPGTLANDRTGSDSRATRPS